MSDPRNKDWNPGAYSRFRGLRLRPALDLLRAVDTTISSPIVDLGCGNGAVGPALKQHFGTRLIGVDSSPSMLEKAGEQASYDELIRADITQWRPEATVGMIFSNAALHWLDDHETLFPKLAELLAPGGVLAVQMPHQNNAPSHRVWTSLIDELFPGRFDPGQGPGVQEPAFYHHLLAPLGAVQLWETVYYQQLEASPTGHPVRHFTESTFARPILGVLSETEQQVLISRYEDVMDKTYPKAEDGRVLFPFRRMFFVMQRPT